MERSTNALAELAKRLRNGLYINPNDKRFDGPVIVRTLDANDVLAAQLIVAELAKVEYGDDGHIRSWTDTEIKLKKCRAIAE